MARMPEPLRRLRASALMGAPDDEPAVHDAAATWFALRDAGMTPNQEQALRRWLAADPRHEAALARLDAAWSTFGKTSRTGQADALLQELANRAIRRRRRRAYAAAASLAVLLTIGVSWRFSGRGDSPAQPSRTARLLVPAKRVLSDGSAVILKDGGKIAVAFTTARRQVQLLQGQAVFEVAADPARPFVVSAGGVEVKAVGTAFSVQLGRKEVEILVAEGTVAVAQEATTRTATLAPTVEEKAAGSVTPDRTQEGPLLPPESTARAFQVSAGNRVVVEITPTAEVPPKVLSVASAVIEESLAWRHLRVEFSGTPLAEAVALLNREAASRSAARLLIDDPALGAMRVSGVFRVDNTDAFVLLLEAGFGVEVQRVGNTVRLRKAATAR